MEEKNCFEKVPGKRTNQRDFDPNEPEPWIDYKTYCKTVCEEGFIFRFDDRDGEKQKASEVYYLCTDNKYKTRNIWKPAGRSIPKKNQRMWCTIADDWFERDMVSLTTNGEFVDREQYKSDQKANLKPPTLPPKRKIPNYTKCTDMPDAECYSGFKCDGPYGLCLPEGGCVRIQQTTNPINCRPYPEGPKKDIHFDFAAGLDCTTLESDAQLYSMDESNMDEFDKSIHKKAQHIIKQFQKAYHPEWKLWIFYESCKKNIKATEAVEDKTEEKGEDSEEESTGTLNSMPDPSGKSLDKEKNSTTKADDKKSNSRNKIESAKKKRR